MTDTEGEISVKMIRLADGTLIDPMTRQPLVSEYQNAKSSPNKIDNPDPEEDDDNEVKLDIVPIERRSIHDLTLGAKQMAVVNNVLVYTLWGLPIDEIAIQCQCSVDDVIAVRNLDEYDRMHDALVDGLRDSYVATVQGQLANAAPKAAKKIINGMKNKSADIALSAAKDVLDRSGYRPVDRIEHSHKFEQGSELVVRIIKAADQEKIPTLDLDVNA